MTNPIPDYVRFHQFPVEISIPIPGKLTAPVEDYVIEISDDANECYNQFIAFTMIASFWYYVVGKAAVSDEEFDHVKSLILKMESDDASGGLTQDVKTACSPNGYSPSGGNRCNHHFSRYPDFIIEMFSRVDHGPETWNIRPWWIDLTVSGKPIEIEVKTNELTMEKRRGTLMEFA